MFLFIFQSFEKQQEVMNKLMKQTKTEGTQINSSFSEVLKDLHEITINSQKKVQKLSDDVKKAIKESTRLLKVDVKTIAEDVKVKLLIF